MDIHNNVRYRRLKTIIKEAAKAWRVNLSNYNLDDITAYKTVGDNLNGVFDNVPEPYTPFVRSNVYEVYEIPYVGNNKTSKEFGRFLLIAYCPDSNVDEYLFLRLKTFMRGNYIDAAFRYVGLFKVKFLSQYQVSIRKFDSSGAHDFKSDKIFDYYKTRYSAYLKHYRENSSQRTNGHANYYKPSSKTKQKIYGNRKKKWGPLISSLRDENHNPAKRWGGKICQNIIFNVVKARSH